MAKKSFAKKGTKNVFYKEKKNALFLMLQNTKENGIIDNDENFFFFCVELAIFLGKHPQHHLLYPPLTPSVRVLRRTGVMWVEERSKKRGRVKMNVPLGHVIKTHIFTIIVFMRVNAWFEVSQSLLSQRQLFKRF